MNRRYRLLVAVMIAFSGVGAGTAGASVPPPVNDLELHSVLIFSRHGMRGPTEAVTCAQSSTDCLNALGQDPWPTLGVAAGNLTTAGGERATSMGQFYRQLYARYNLLPATGCPSASQVGFISDTVERTMVTAGSVMNGMFAGCLMSALTVYPELYTPPSSCTVPPSLQQTATNQLIGSWQTLIQNRLTAPLQKMSAIVGPLQEVMCKQYRLNANCKLTDLPTSGTPPAAIQLLSQSTEQLIMQYGSGLPAAQVGWGRVVKPLSLQSMSAALSEVNAIHAAYDWALDYPSQVATLEGSQVMSVLLKTLSAQAALATPSFMFVASHDTLILNVAGMLGLKWQLDSYQPFQVPPGGAIAIELWKDKGNGDLTARMVYYAQTIDQLHANTPLTLEKPPAYQVLDVPNCADGPGGTCPWTSLNTIATAASTKACINTAVYNQPYPIGQGASD